MTYDYETKSSYAVTVKADDSNGGTDTIAVAINLLDVNDDDPDSAQTPSLSSISFFSSPASGDTYTRGEDIADKRQIRRGRGTEQPTPAEVGVDGRQRHGTGFGQSQRATRELVFTYTVKESDLDADGISVPANPLSLNGGAITVPGDPDTAVTLTHPGTADDPTRKVDGSTVVIPTVQLIVVRKNSSGGRHLPPWRDHRCGCPVRQEGESNRCSRSSR